mgnify:CR=1 FL=1|tara:strand:+ start:183 stop:602 length:420 start_codon:yes stop_codon:yes gene_type:complete
MIRKQNYDFAGITLSVLCGLHCIITPIAVLNFPKYGKAIESPWMQFSLLFLIAFAFYKSVLRGFQIHKSKLTLGLGVTGFLILISTYMLEIFGDHHEHAHHGHEAHDEKYTIMLAIIGSALMIISHIKNIINCKCVEKN